MQFDVIFMISSNQSILFILIPINIYILEILNGFH